MESNQLQQHVFASYRSLRVGMAIMGIAFPLVLWLGGKFQGMPLQASMSAYYHQVAGPHSMRDWFVGILFAIGAFLYLYKGFSKLEDWALNIGGACAIGIATCPMPWNCAPYCGFSIHYVFAICFFLCIAYVCIFRASDTLHLLQDRQRERKFQATYRALGILMIISPLAALLMALVFMRLKEYTFFAELTGIWTFAFYWLVKSRELSVTNAEQLALGGRLKTGSQRQTGTA